MSVVLTTHKLAADSIELEQGERLGWTKVGNICASPGFAESVSA